MALKVALRERSLANVLSPVALRERSLANVLSPVALRERSFVNVLSPVAPLERSLAIAESFSSAPLSRMRTIAFSRVAAAVER